MIARNFLASFGAVVFLVFVLVVTSSAASGQTPMPGGFEIRLLPGFTHQPLQGIDSIVGKIVNKDGPEMLYEIGRIPEKGAPLLGGSFANQALQLPAGERLWLKEQTVDGRKFSIAYSKDQRLLVSTASAKQGVNFSAIAKSPAEVADILLMTLTLAEQKPKSATLGQPEPQGEKDAEAAREMILESTNRALSALVQANKERSDGSLHINNVSAYVAVVGPDFRQVDASGQVIGRAKEGQRNWAGVVPLKTTAPVPGETMNLLEATSKIAQIQMLSTDEAIVTGEERFHWIGAVMHVIEKTQDDGSVAVMPNTEQRYVTNTYRRRWIRGKDGIWRLDSSRIIATNQASTL